jgi:lipopolysaccharide export system permease protein
MALGSVAKFFLGAELMLVVLLLLADLFWNIWRFLAYDIPWQSILLWTVQGLPSHGTEALPVALLFAITFTLSELYANGELLVIFGAGISIRSLTFPIFVLSALLSFMLFLGSDLVTVPTSSARDTLYKKMTGQDTTSQQISNITIISKAGKLLYNVGLYDSKEKTLINVDVVQRNEAMRPIMRVVARSAKWDGQQWVFQEAKVYSVRENGDWTVNDFPSYANVLFDERPESFETLAADPKFMTRQELKNYVGFLKSAGLPFAEAATEYHKRFSFCLTPIIVCGLSIAFSGLFRKNSLLMSLLFSLGSATIYYVAEMVGGIAAKTGWVEPAVGIWPISIVFIIISIFGFFRAKT